MSNCEIEKSPTVVRERCGSTTGYAYHRRNKEVICQPCLDAHHIYSVAYYAKNKESVIAREKQNKLNDPEKFKAKARKYRAANPEKLKENSRVNYLKNIERVRENRVADRLANPEKFRLRDLHNRLSNPERMLVSSRKRRARKREAVSEPYTTQQILDLYGTDCHICKEPIDLTAARSVRKKGYQRGLHLDHVIPLAKGGTDLIENVKPSHAKCNLKKNARLVA